MPERSVQNLISITAGGLSIATFPEIKQAVQNKYKEIYGSDIDLTNTTADGVFIENICLIISNILTTTEMLYSNLNINTAQGEYLENLCALTGVYRKQATKSTAQLEITNNEANTITLNSVNNLTFVDKSGYTWSSDIGNIESPFTTLDLDPGVKTLVTVYCDEYGPVTAPKDWIYQLINLSYDLTISQPNDAIVGSYIESDAELRARRNETISSIGLSTIGNLKGALLEITGIEDVEIYNNNTSSYMTAKDGTNILSRSVYIIIKKTKDLDILPETLGSRIYEKLTPGILTTDFNGLATTGVSKSYTYSSGHGLTNDVYWKEATPITIDTEDLKISIKLKTKQYFTDDTYQILKETIVNYLNSLDINQQFSTYELVNELNEVDPMFGGKKTYDVIDVDLSWLSSNTPFNKDLETGSLYNYQAKDTYFNIDINNIANEDIDDYGTYIEYNLYGEV